MSDIEGLTQFTLTGLESAIVADTSDDGSDLDAVGVRVGVTITARPEVVQLATTPPRTVRIRPVKVRIEDGVLVLPGGVEGDVRLVADTDVLGLDGHLLYDVKFGSGSVGGEQIDFGDQNFTFAAPTSDTTVDMSEVERLAGRTPAGTQLRMVPDRVRTNDDGKIVFSSNGVDLPDPLTVSGGGGGGSTAWTDITGKPAVIAAGATQALARTAIGAVDSAAVTTLINAVIAGAPGALDTLNELAAALGDDADFAATVTSALAGKQPLDADLTALAALTAPATKLAGIAAGATVNDTDANLKARANHTGTQSADTITDGTTNKSFTAAEKSKLAAISGTNTGDQDLSSYATSAAVAAGYQPLDADLTALAALTAPATKLAGIAAGATANDTDANLKARANHTGTQAPATVAFAATARLLGRATAGAGAGEEITLGTNLSLSGTTLNATGGSGGGDASTNTATSVDSEIMLFSGTGGKTAKRATTTGILKGTSGVIGAATAGTDYYAPTGTDVAITDGGTGVSTLPSGLLKGAGTGAITAATAGTDYLAPTGSAASLTSFPTLNQSTTGSAATLTTSRTVQTNLASTSSASFNGSANITPGVTGTLPVGNGGTGAATLTGIVKGTGTTAMVAATAETDYVTPTGAGTISGKRIVPRVPAVTAGATPAINTDLTDVVVITGLTVNITSMTSGLTGTPNSEQPLRFAITGTAARTISWGTSFEDGAVPLPTTTVTTQRLDVGFFWNSATSKFRCMASGSA